LPNAAIPDNYHVDKFADSNPAGGLVPLDSLSQRIQYIINDLAALDHGGTAGMAFAISGIKFRLPRECNAIGFRRLTANTR
jgi:hypothetical protein